MLMKPLCGGVSACCLCFFGGCDFRFWRFPHSRTNRTQIYTLRHTNNGSRPTFADYSSGFLAPVRSFNIWHLFWAFALHCRGDVTPPTGTLAERKAAKVYKLNIFIIYKHCLYLCLSASGPTCFWAIYFDRPARVLFFYVFTLTLFNTSIFIDI